MKLMKFFNSQKDHFFFKQTCMEFNFKAFTRLILIIISSEGQLQCLMP